ncbi:uncharacterized protein LOC119905017 isoform X2 [Micropterus salmoides]|uniref:uncharacterized protein LOC119905017 isoform X2 n=1 Tax=Micropterus salmoides TaxID=27706 RepID=UPI0018ED9549|nr:uncharacterized protein LOC119905017 isoform X2 [Micropterus salmoides]
MKVRHTLICFFFLSLQDGNTGLTNDQIPSVYTGTEGGDITVTCSFSSYGSSIFFCKRECKREDILIHTTGVRDQRGRYRIRYERGGNIFVSITQLTKSDSGLYRCGLGGSNIRFEIIVVDDPSASKPTQISQTDQQQTGTASPRAHVVPTSKPKFTLLVFSTSDPSASTPTQISQTDQQQTGTASPRGVLQYVVPILVIIVILSGLPLMIIYIQWNSKPKGLQTRGNSDETIMEIALYENCPPASTSESTYESLDPASRDQNQTYATLTHTQHK